MGLISLGLALFEGGQQVFGSMDLALRKRTDCGFVWKIARIRGF